jgi:ribosome assembly protein 1
VWATAGLQGHVAALCGAPAATAASAPPAFLASAVAALKSALQQGFSLACQAGPLCGEPLWASLFVLDAASVSLLAPPHAPAPSAAAAAAAAAPPPPALAAPSGQLLCAVRDACRTAFEAGRPRLAEALFRCELQVSGGRGGGGEQLGRCYGVLAKRRARVLREDLFEGTETFLVTALLPVAESFGFADDLRKRTQGAATAPQLVFERWERVRVDPFFRPSTREEREALGDTLHAGQGRNLARAFVDAVRERKGMPVARKIVADGDKQRNLSRKK